jgi:hypothetical protein
MQAEYATDLVFKRQSTVQAFYPRLMETLIQAVKPVDIATFLGRKLHGNYQGEMGNRFNMRWLGRRIRHQMGPVVIKMYDKFNIVLRIETTVNQVSFFKQYRQSGQSSGWFYLHAMGSHEENHLQPVPSAGNFAGCQSTLS